MRGHRLWLGLMVGAFVAGLLLPTSGQAGEAGPQLQDTLNAVVKKGEVIVGTFDFYPPWGFRDAQNNIVGMDVDIAKELASDDVLKVKLTLVPVPTTQDRINFLLSGKIDVAISNFTATLPRSKAITFSALAPLKPGHTWVIIVTPFSSFTDAGSGEWKLRFYPPEGSQ